MESTFENKPEEDRPSPLRLRCQERLEIMAPLSEKDKLLSLVKDLDEALAKIGQERISESLVLQLLEIRLRRNLPHRLQRLINIQYRSGIEQFPELVRIIEDYDEEFLYTTRDMLKALGC